MADAGAAEDYEDDFEEYDEEADAKSSALPATRSGPSWPNIEYSDVAMGDKLGGGGVSVVYRAVWAGRECAVKTVVDPSASDSVVEEYRNELLVMCDLKHPNIVAVLGACLKPPNLLIAMELCGPSVHRLLHELHVSFDAAKRIRIAREVGTAMHYLHGLDQPVIHRDIKSGNVLVDDVTGDAKLCDFGLASTKVVTAGTPAYMAPELLQGKPYNKSVDVYAFGVFFWELHSGHMPFDGYDIPGVRAKVLAKERPKPPLSCPRAMSRLMQDCWQHDSALRPSFEVILARLEEAAPAAAADFVMPKFVDSLDALMM